MSRYKIVSIVGARPQFVKAATLSRAFAKDSRFQEGIIHTGQHYDENMSDVFFTELGIPKPLHRFEFGGMSHGRMTGAMLASIEDVLQSDRPDAMVIYGDTNSTLAGALAASKIHIPVAHIEAGLRSFNKAMPEEINRILSDHVSSLLLCPTQSAADNLSEEGVSDGVHVVGDVMYDATLYAKAKASESDDLRHRLELPLGDYAVCTLHRQENTDNSERFETVISFIENKAKDMPVILPLHPRTKARLAQAGRELSGVILTDPLGYFDLQALLAGASLVLTDSGGLQKEAYFHGVPCITLRDETEWVETIEAGWNRLWTTREFKSPKRQIPDYGTGQAAETCVDILANYLENRVK